MYWFIFSFNADFSFIAVYVTFGYRNFQRICTGPDTASALGRCNSLPALKVKQCRKSLHSG